ncbi:hypothetical protein PVAND_005948 [Polypedilum vanderplanki]|uniref:Uncharacterized protein n=1 Tax=Polypedilum vanderplanki TaxID=319348 RepID=A0A9J6C3I9_POLVA|nr:hypothetical protein PVAND_005948 [Polypedilum vanderplanki]
MFSYDRESKILSGIELEPFYHHNVTAGQLLIHYLQRDPTKIIQSCYDTGVNITAAEMEQLGLRVAKNILKENLKLGDVIGLVAKNTTYVAPLVLGCLLTGNPISTLDPTFDPNEIANIFRQTLPKLVFCDHDNWENVIEALKMCKNDAEVITIDEKMTGVRFIGEFFELLPGERPFFPRSFGIEAFRLCGVILCSSGTTALSKGTMLSHSQCILMSRAFPIHYPTGICFSSLYWLSGFTVLMQSLCGNIRRIITRRPFSPLLMIHLIEQYKASVLLTPPSQIAMLLQSPFLKLADLSSVRLHVVAGGFIDESMRKSMQGHLLYGALLVTYGMTEVASIISITAPLQKFSNSSGKINPNFKLKIVDDDGNSLDPNNVGEIYLKAPYRFLGYANNVEDTKNAFDSDGWLKTGDLGYITEDGEIFVVDRKKDMIKYMNYQVAPSEIEAFVNAMDGVQQVTVVGIPDMLRGDLAVAIVVKEKDADLTEQDIIDEVAKNFPLFKRLHGGAFFVNELPMTPSGKIKKRIVREMAARMYKSQEINGNY